jgi:hypothetical protein
LLAASVYATVPETPTVFNATGTFDGGEDSLGGTITIDTTGSGGILSQDLTVTVGSSTTYTFTSGNSGSGVHSFFSSGAPYYDNALFFGDSAELNLDIVLGSLPSFVGYTGGALCSDGGGGGGTSCGNGSPVTTFTIFSSQGPADPNLSSGSLGLAAPEPSTALLAMGGGAAVLALRRRKRRA